jgi:hypothetical protein
MATKADHVAAALEVEGLVEGASSFGSSSDILDGIEGIQHLEDDDGGGLDGTQELLHSSAEVDILQGTQHLEEYTSSGISIPPPLQVGVAPIDLMGPAAIESPKVAQSARELREPIEEVGTEGGNKFSEPRSPAKISQHFRLAGSKVKSVGHTSSCRKASLFDPKTLHALNKTATKLNSGVEEHHARLQKKQAQRRRRASIGEAQSYDRANEIQNQGGGLGLGALVKKNTLSGTVPPPGRKTEEKPASPVRRIHSVGSMAGKRNSLVSSESTENSSSANSISNLFDKSKLLELSSELEKSMVSRERGMTVVKKKANDIGGNPMVAAIDGTVNGPPKLSNALYWEVSFCDIEAKKSGCKIMSRGGAFSLYMLCC